MKTITDKSKKDCYFDIDLRLRKPVGVRLSFAEGFLEFKGKSCMDDFIFEILRHRYRGLHIQPMDNDSRCIDILYKYLEKRKYAVSTDVKYGEITKFKLYQHKYYDAKGVIIHSNITTFVKPWIKTE